MPKVTAESTGEFYQHYPKVAAIVTAKSGGKSNAMAAAWHSAISRQPSLYGVALSPKRFTYQLIMESQQFGINFMPFEAVELVAAVGGSKGAELDKFQKFAIAQDKPLKTNVPILKDAYVAYECSLVDHKTYGDHIWLVGEVLAVHFVEEAFTSKQVIDLNRVRPVLYLGADLYATTDKDSLRFLEREIYDKR